MNTKYQNIFGYSPSQKEETFSKNIAPQRENPSFMQPKSTSQQTIPPRSRIPTPIPFFILNLSMPLSLTGLNVFIFLSIQNRSILLSSLLIGICVFGLIISIWQSLLIANWRDVLRLYFVLDSLIPVLIAGFLGLYTLLNFLNQGNWYEYCFSICFPVWLFYFAGYLRVIIAHGAWKKWQIIIYKLVVVCCGLAFFYIGIYYMNGAYKITNGMMPELEEKLKNLVLLYVFGNNQLFFQYYRRISEFDQTEELQYSYEFKERKSGRNQRKIVDIDKEFMKDVLQKQAEINRQINFKIVRKKIST